MINLFFIFSFIILQVQLSPEMLRNLRMKRDKEKETQRDKKKLKEWEELVTYYRREYEKTVYPKVG